MALAFFIPKGKIKLLQGDPGDGKSTFMLTLAAYMSRGEPLPFTDYEEPPEPIKVMYQSNEIRIKVNNLHCCFS